MDARECREFLPALDSDVRHEEEAEPAEGKSISHLNPSDLSVALSSALITTYLSHAHLELALSPR